MSETLGILGEQLDVMSTVALQNRQALGWMMAEKEGVCYMLGDECCIFIPSNTATFSEATSKIKKLKGELRENAGKDRWS